MTEIIDSPDIDIVIRAETQDRVRDRRMQIVSAYKPPLDGTPDMHRQFDDFIAMQVHTILAAQFPGYPWDVKCDARQGVIYFGIPILMGATLRWVIRLAQWTDLSPALVMRCGGELLERFNQPRTGFDAAAFLHQRDNKHLAQVDLKRAA